jgi:hypothetical protein
MSIVDVFLHCHENTDSLVDKQGGHKVDTARWTKLATEKNEKRTTAPAVKVMAVCPHPTVPARSLLYGTGRVAAHHTTGNHCGQDGDDPVDEVLPVIAVLALDPFHHPFAARLQLATPKTVPPRSQQKTTLFLGIFRNCAK